MESYLCCSDLLRRKMQLKIIEKDKNRRMFTGIMRTKYMVELMCLPPILYQTPGFQAQVHGSPLEPSIQLVSPILLVPMAAMHIIFHTVSRNAQSFPSYCLPYSCFSAVNTPGWRNQHFVYQTLSTLLPNKAETIAGDLPVFYQKMKGLLSFLSNLLLIYFFSSSWR